MNAASPAPATQPIPVFDLHCDTADRLSWQTLSGSLRKAAGMHFYGPGDEADPAGCRQLARNHGAISVEKVGATPWAQCFACFVPDELSPEEAVAFEAHVSAYLADQVAACAELGAVAVTRASQVRPLLEGAPAGEKGARLVAVRTIENARLFAADLGLVERLARQGLLCPDGWLPTCTFRSLLLREAFHCGSPQSFRYGVQNPTGLKVAQSVQALEQLISISGHLCPD